jgi:LAO/AO transport system kinase
MNKDQYNHSALSVTQGVEQPDSVNKGAVERIKSARRKSPSSVMFVEGIISGNRTILSQAITLIESSLDSHQKTAQDIIEKCLPYSGNSIRIGITGVPGVGKSTFIETFGNYLTSLGKKLAVLAIDPSSERSGGSIMGDKTRMDMLSVNPLAFIRPSPSGGTLGGVARKTRESIILCEAAGFDTVFIETVGVGQSETAVHSMVDFFLLLMLAGAGDELQGIKRGIMEMADMIAINKADGNNIDKANVARGEYQNALQLFPPSASGWTPKVMTCSAKQNHGIAEIWETITGYREHCSRNNYFTQRRNEQSKYWMYETLNDQLKRQFYSNPEIQNFAGELEKQVLENRISSFVAAAELIRIHNLRMRKQKQ